MKAISCVAVALMVIPLVTGCTEKEPSRADVTQPWLTTLLGDELVDASGNRVSSETLNGKTVGLYFSAHWCPPCKLFSPKLVAAYDKMAEAGKPFEIVLISSDRNENAMFNYMKELKMHWKALPYASEKRTELARKYKVSGIPTLIILGEDGETITRKGRDDVMRLGADAFARWQP